LHRTEAQVWPFALAVLAALALAAACGRRAVAAEPPAFAPEQLGGTRRSILNAEPQTLNPLTSKDLYATMVQDYIFESLIERDPDTLEMTPLLAESWEVSPDGKVITFRLDPRAKFSDGKPVTADDVVFTYQTIVNPEIDCRGLASYFEDCAGCEKLDERTVRFTWTTTYFKSLEFSAVVVLPRHIYAFTDPKTFNDLNDRLVGSGPYAFKEWRTGQHILLERNTNYWRNRPAFDRILWRFILEDQAAVQALKAGQLDEMPVTPEWWLKLRADPALKNGFQYFRYTTPANGYAFLGWNNVREPFTDARVRQAMTHIVWREQLLKYLRFGIGEVIAGPFWPESPQYNKDLHPLPFDRDAARRLLKEAGWEDRDADGWVEDASGRRLAFELAYVGGNQETRDFVRIVREEFRRMGIDMSERAYAWPVFTTKLDNRDFDVVLLAWGGGGVESDPYQIWHAKEIENRGSNFIGFRNAESDRIIEEARITLDPAKRNALYWRFQEILHREQPYTFLWSRESLRVVAPRLKGVRQHRLGLIWREWYRERRPGEPEEGEAP
jgi:peptide/nickel transport system substrate-binding protein